MTPYFPRLFGLGGEGGYFRRGVFTLGGAGFALPEISRSMWKSSSRVISVLCMTHQAWNARFFVGVSRKFSGSVRFSSVSSCACGILLTVFGVVWQSSNRDLLGGD